MNYFHVPRGFSVTSTLAPHCSPLLIPTTLTSRPPIDLFPVQLPQLHATLFGHPLGHVFPSWPLFFGLLHVYYLLMRSLTRVTLSIAHATISHTTSRRNQRFAREFQFPLHCTYPILVSTDRPVFFSFITGSP